MVPHAKEQSFGNLDQHLTAARPTNGVALRWGRSERPGICTEEWGHPGNVFVKKAGGSFKVPKAQKDSAGSEICILKNQRNRGKCERRTGGLFAKAADKTRCGRKWCSQPRKKQGRY